MPIADLARRMAVFAGMVDRLDQNVGRVVAHLQEIGQFENTLILSLSDNGACAEWDPWGFDQNSGPQNMLHTGDDLKAVGGPGSYFSYGSDWANACHTPWRLYKHYNHEGGIRTPLIAHWPAGLKTKPGSLHASAGSITDLMPTLCELTGARYPTERNDENILPAEGISLAPAHRGEPRLARTIFIEHEGNRSVREGDWKLVALEGKPWELYDLANDPAEMQDLAPRESRRVQKMAQEWEQWALRCSVKARGTSVATPQIANHPLTMRCEIEPESRDGVILAQGGQQNGYALHLKDGALDFSVSIAGKLFATRAAEIPRGRFSPKANLEKSGAMTLQVNGREVAHGQARCLIPTQPLDELSLGEDTKTAVGDYAPPFPFKGTVTNVKILTE